MNSDAFEKLSPIRLFFKCAVPSMITMVFGALYQIADGIFVGRFVGQDALAAINIIMPVLMMVFGISNMVASGTSVNCSILLGGKKQKEASRIFSFSLTFIFILACVIGLFGFFFAEKFIRFISPGASEQAIHYGVEYLKIHSAFSPPVLIYFATDNYLRVCGKEKLSMWLGIITQGVNIALDVVLVAYLGFGIRAVALTSCASMALGSVITLLLFRKKKMDLYYNFGKVPIKKFFHVLANGSSEFFNNISTSVMSVVLNLFLLKYGGTVGVAAFSVVMYVDSIIGMMSFGMCEALQPAISYCYGAKQMKRVRSIFKCLLVGVITTSLLAFLFMFFCGPSVAPIFIKGSDHNLLTVSVVAIKFFSYSYLFGWMDLSFSSLFTALDQPGKSFFISIFGTLIFPIAFLFLLSYLWGLTGVWLMPAISCTVSGIFTFVLTLLSKPLKD